MALVSAYRDNVRTENLTDKFGREDEVMSNATDATFEPISDSCGESDMEGLDLSLFEPQGDNSSWCESRIHTGVLNMLVHSLDCCGKPLIASSSYGRTFRC